MKYFIKKIQLNESETWEISGFTDGKINSIEAYYNELREYKHPEQKLNIPFEQRGNLFTAFISITEIAKLSLADQETTWKFKINGEYPYNNLSTDGPIMNKPLQLKNSLYQYQFEFPEGVLTLISKPMEIFSTLENFSMDEDTIAGRVKLEPSLKNGLFQAKLIFKRRPNASFYLFHEQTQEFDLGLINDNKVDFSISIKDLSTNFLVDTTNVIDVLIDISTLEIKKSIPIYLSINPDMKSSIQKEVDTPTPLFTTLKSYVTGSNRLSFYFKKNFQGLVSLTKLSQNSDSIILHFKSENFFDKSKLVAKRRDKKANTFEYNTEQVWPLKKGISKYAVNIDKKEFLTGPVNKADTIWDFYIRSSNMPDLPVLASRTIDFSASDYFDIANKQFKAKLTRNGLNNLSCYTIVAPKIKSDTTRIAVMGTCFSRNVFNSSPYFNPDYKAFFECSFTQFHSSIISVMTEQFTEINLNKYNDMTTNERTTVEEDWKKEFFNNLRNSNSDYFLIDLYPDVIRPVIWINNKIAITLSYVVEQSQLLNDISWERISDHIDNEAFFEEWKYYADQFIEKLTEIIPANRVILNLGGFTTSYYDEKGKVVNYKNKMGIEKNNYFWDRLNNYFLSKLPEAKVIDFSKKNYIGDFNYPFGHSFSHFESSYYKDFLKELIYITKS
ncbi:teichoic acid biosynthesis protein [Listeria welshimeri]|nr:teichoic acid biosynthesis protein [Listeria welshimeri]MBC2376912.1 teichoic acid biosynthesis protein [Listeria welshimeri]